MSYLSEPWTLSEAEKQELRGNIAEPSLPRQEALEAIHELKDSSFVRKFKRVDRMYVDPIYGGQKYSLHSFVPSKGAKPDKNGMYGFMKCRGCFTSLTEAEQRASLIIKDVDSYHGIQIVYTGKPFPICTDVKKYTEKNLEVDLENDEHKIIGSQVQEEQSRERKEVQSIKEREQKIRQENEDRIKGKDEKKMDPLDEYIMNRVKLAHSVQVYIESLNTIKTLRNKLRNLHKTIHEVDQKDPSFNESYMKRYIETCKEVGIDVEAEPSFITYMQGNVSEFIDFDILSEPEVVREPEHPNSILPEAPTV